MKTFQSAGFSSGKVVFTEQPVPEPGPNQVLVRMKACGICKFDIKNYKEPPDNPGYSSAPGHEGIGVVEDTGQGVHGLKPGDLVTSCAMGGAMSEYYTADQSTVVRVPDHVTELRFWIMEPVACVVSSIRLLGLEPGQRVVVLGCGYMGQLLLQGLPRQLIPVLIAIEPLKDRLEMAIRNGADTAINPSEIDPVQGVLDATGGGADLVIEATGVKGILHAATSMLRAGGTLCMFGHHAEDEIAPTDAWHMRGIRVWNTTPFSSRDFHRDMADAVALTHKGVYDQREMIQCTYALQDLPRAMEETAHDPGIMKAVLLS